MVVPSPGGGCGVVLGAGEGATGCSAPPPVAVEPEVVEGDAGVVLGWPDPEGEEGSEVVSDSVWVGPVDECAPGLIGCAVVVGGAGSGVVVAGVVVAGAAGW